MKGLPAKRATGALTDQALVDRGVDLMGSLAELAGALNTSVKALSNARQTHGPNAHTPLPSGLRPLLIELIERDGHLAVPAPPRHTGRRETAFPRDGNLCLRLLPAEIEAFEATAAEQDAPAMHVALARAVKRYLAQHPPPRDLPRDLPPEPEGAVSWRCRLDEEVLAALNARVGHVGWRRPILRAAVLAWTAAFTGRDSARPSGVKRAA